MALATLILEWSIALEKPNIYDATAQSGAGI